MSDAMKCPFAGHAPKHTQAHAPSNASWWPDQLNLKILHQQIGRAHV
jgi:catalase-peroxidase